MKLKDSDELANLCLITDEDILIITKNGMSIRIKSTEISSQGRLTTGVKGITLSKDDEVLTALPIRDLKDDLAIFYTAGTAKRISLTELPCQNRAGKGLTVADKNLASASLVNDNDVVLISGDTNSICVSCKDIPKMARSNAFGNTMIKNSKIVSVTKV